MQNLKPMSTASIRRAYKADPNGGRCLIENCPMSKGVEVAHVVPRSLSENPKTIKSLEWSWKMRKRTLHLDTRRNVFFLTSTMNVLYKQGKWALLPEEHIIDQYFSKGKFPAPLSRNRLPNIEGETFNYTLIPLLDMSEFGILRQNDTDLKNSVATDSEAFTVHRYPFESFPTLTSHVHPTFVLFHLASLLFNGSTNPHRPDFVRTSLLLRKIRQLYPSWNPRRLGPSSRTDPTFVIKPAVLDAVGINEDDEDDPWQFDDPPSSDDDFDDQSSDGDSVSTPLHRIRPRYPPSHQAATTHLQYSPGKRKNRSDDEEVSPDSKRRRTTQSQLVLANVIRSGDSDDGWTTKSISEWAAGERAQSPPLSPPQPVFTSSNP